MGTTQRIAITYEGARELRKLGSRLRRAHQEAETANEALMVAMTRLDDFEFKNDILDETNEVGHWLASAQASVVDLDKRLGTLAAKIERVLGQRSRGSYPALANGGAGKGENPHVAARWASYDVDDPDGDDYCAVTEVHTDGQVHQYDATNGSFWVGHGHTGYASMQDFMEGNQLPWSRSPYDVDSVGRPWKSGF